VVSTPPSLTPCISFSLSCSLLPSPFLRCSYYFSPFSWTVRSMVVNELTSAPYLVPLQPGAPNKADAYLASFGFVNSMAYKWAGLAYCLGFAAVFGLLLSTLAVKYRRVREAEGTQRISEAAFLAAAAASSAAMDSPAAEQRSPAVASSPSPRSPRSPSALPFTPATLSFSGLSYTVTLPDKARTQKQLLRGVSGIARPGTLTALMGASGAGKTTLLDVLAFRKTTGAIEGSIAVNGRRTAAADFVAQSGFAEQEDIAMDFCTVREAVQFSAALRLPLVTPAARSAHVQEVLDLLELVPLAERRTGALALGERKRLTIAVELACNPAILFLDEPTTGLDARAAAVVMRVVRRVASTGRTVIATIHQPSAEVFFSFDQLLCLAPGGLQTYGGPLGRRAAQLVAYLSLIPGVRPLPSGTNPATWMLESMAAAGSGGGPAAAAAAAVEAGSAGNRPAAATDVPSAFASSALASTLAAELSALTAAGAKAGPAPAALQRPGFFSQLAQLVWRMLAFSWRNTSWNGVRLFVFLVLAMLFGLLYRNVDDSTYSGAFSKLAVALNGLLFLSIINLNTGLPNYSRLRAVFYRERSAGTYAAVAYPLTLALCELPWTAFFALVFCSINYFLVGFKAAAGPFFTSYLATVLAAMWFAILAMGFIAFFPVPLLAQIAGGPTIQISILFAGVNLSREQLPSGWRWLYDANGFAHALRLFFLPQYAGDLTPILLPGDPSQPLFITRSDFSLLRMGVGSDQTWAELGYLLAILGGALVLMVM
jgi:ABC-type multidrug transport system ATPase subunit